MAENIKIGVTLDDGGSTEKLTAKTLKLKDAVDNTVVSAGRMASTIAKAAMAPKTSAAIKEASQSPQESIEYGQARAAVGTGAAGRDFAKQAQGLGGLVHVYATFAANLFAVSAAFTALKDAANTENMVKGLDQLGAASGRSLGALSKQLVETTGGALSLRDAMGAVAQASSAGLGNKQINDIAVVAAKASNALGISMTDAISRLSRGISKIEPELLDELGIFVKVDEATNKYALSVGKTAGSLSDFEKRQAFANAVLEQGKAKFAAIEASPNPYDRLLASISNLSTALLTLLNGPVGSFANFLASSPTALGLGIAYIVKLLVSQALPALGQFRESLKKSADDALKVAERFKSGFGDEFQTKLEKLFKIPDLKSDLKKLEDGLKTVKIPDKLAKGSIGTLLAASEEDTKALANANKALDLRNKLIETGKKGTKDATEAQIDAAKEERAAIQQSIAVYEKRMQIQNAFDKALVVAGKKQGMTDPEVVALKRYQDMRKKADQYDAIANASSNAQILGITKSWSLLNQEVEEKGITGISKYTTLAKGGLAAVGSRVMGLVSAFSNVFQAIGIGVAIYSVWDNYASKATKEQEDFNTKVETTSSAIKTVSDTFDLYTKKSTSAFNIEAIGAYTTALATVSDSLDAQILSFNKFNEAAGAWDRFKDSIGSSNLDKLQISTVKSIQGIVKSLELSGNSQSAKGILAKALFGEDANADIVLGDTKELSKAFDGLTNSEREEKINRISAAIGKIKEQEEYSTNAAKAFIESLSAVDKLVDQMIQANAFTDLQGKLGVELVQASDKLAQALMDPLKALEDMAKLGKDPKALAVLGDLDVAGLVKAAEYTKKLSDAQKELGKTSSDLEKAKSGGGKLAAAAREAAGSLQFKTFADNDTIRSSQALDVVLAQKAADKARSDLESLKREGAAFALTQTKLITEIADAGFVKIELGLKRAKELADISVTRTALSVASNLGADTSAQEYKLKLQEIDIQKSLIEASYNAQIATNKNTEEITKLNATQQILASEALKNKQGATAEEKALADTLAKGAQRVLSSIEAKRALKDGNTSESETTRLYGKEAVLSAKSSIKTDLIPGMQKDSATAMANAQAASALIEKQSKELEFQARKVSDKNTLEKETLTIQQEVLNLASQLNSYSSASLIDAKSAIQQKSLELDVETKIAKIKSDQARLDLDKVKNSIAPEEYKRLSDLNTQRLNNIDADKQAKTLAIDINNIRDKGAAKQAEISTQQGIQSEKLKISSTLEEAKISSLQKQLDIKLQLNQIDELTANREKGKLELNSQAVKNAQEELRLKGDILAKQAALDTATNVVNKLGGTEAQTPEQALALSQATVNQANAQAQLDNAKASLDVNKQVNELTVKSIADNTILNQKLIEQKDHLASISSLTENLSNIFGNFGKSLGGVISAFDTLTTNEKNRAAALSEEKVGTEAYNKLKSKQARQELDDQAKVAGAAKKLFKEKTFAYKTLDGLEKMRSVQSIALSIKEFAIKSGLLKQEQIDELAASAKSLALKASDALKSIGIDIPAIYAKFMSVMGPFGPPAAAAAIAAFVGSVFGGGGGATAPFVPTAEQRQKTQGTAMGYDAQGNLVQTSRGVFGDTEAKSASIANSLEIIKNTSVKGLDYDDKMLRALTNLANALDTTAKGLYAITGIRAGSLSGITEGTNSGGGFLGIGGLFSSSTTKSIIDSGLQLKGTFLELVNGVESTINVFETISTTVKKSGFFGIGGSTSTYVSTNFKQLSGLDPKAFQSLVNAFGYAADLLYNVAEIAGKSSDEVTHAMSLIRVDQMASLRGLTGEEFTKQLSAVISSVLDETSLIIFAEYEKFAKFGEGMLETVVRVIDDNRKVTKQLDNMMIKSITDTLSITGTVPAYKEAITYSINNLANITADEANKAAAILGDSSKLSESWSWFGSTITDSVQNQLQNLSQSDLQKLADAGISFVSQATTVISDGITTSFAESDLRMASMQITENLVNLAGGIENFLDQSNYFVDNFLTDAEKVVPAQKAVIKQLAAMGYASVDTKDEFKALVQSLDLTTTTGQQTYQQLMDLAPGFIEVIDLVEQQSQAVKDAITNFKDFIQQIKEFKNSLLLGSNSILTPGEKYAEAKSQFDTIYAQALAGDKTAMSKVTSSAQSFLDASKTYFASSEAYTTDFNTVLSKLDNATISAGASISVAELQLSALSIHTDLLTSINTNIALIAGVPAAASGGRVSGLTLVGEMGPELVDFSTPGRVYTADQTAGMFTPTNTGVGIQQALIQEVQKLREEVAKLREQQSTETGHLINATYDAQHKNAEQVTEGVMDAAARQAWVANFRENALINK